MQVKIRTVGRILMPDVKAAGLEGPDSVTQWNTKSMACALSSGLTKSSGRGSRNDLDRQWNMSTGATSRISVTL